MTTRIAEKVMVYEFFYQNYPIQMLNTEYDVEIRDRNK